MTMARWQATITDDAGNVVTGAKVEVRKEVPGAALAALKEDRDGLVGMSNPFNAGSDGYAAFSMLGGAFKIRAYTGPSGAPTFERIWRYVPIGTAAENDSETFLNAISTAVHAEPFGFRNRIINPSGQIAQAGVASTADGAYTGFVQWLALTQSNAVTPSALTNVENGTPFMMRLLQANATPQRYGCVQWIESANCIDLRGQAVTLSARVRMSAATTLRYAIVEWTGTADAITKDIVNDWTNATFTAGNFFKSTTTTIVATGSVALSAATLASISLTGTISGSANNLAVFFWTDSTQAQNVTLDIGKVQLEAGATATPLAVRAYQQELELCQRYWESAYALGTAPGSSVQSAGGAIGQDQTTVFRPIMLHGFNDLNRHWATLDFRSLKRTSPSVSYWDLAGNASAFTAYDINGAAGVHNNTADVFRSIVGSINGLRATNSPGSGKYFSSAMWRADARL